MKDKKQLKLIAAPFTPMDNKGNIKIEIIDQYVRHLINSKMDGAFICGTTGEGVSMTTEERKLVLEEWVKQAGGKLKIITHVGGNSVPQSEELAAHAEESGAYGVAAFAPTFFKPQTTEELVDFLVPIAASAPNLPFYFYHIPSLTGVNLSVSEIFSIADKRIPNFAGAKFTHFDFYDMQRCMDYENGKYEVMHGFDETLLCGLSLNIQSAVGSTYNYIPEVYFNIWNAYRAGDMDKAREWQQVSVKMVNVLNKYGGGVRAGKAVMELIGVDCGPCRLPIKNLSVDELKGLKKELSDIGFFKFIAKSKKEAIGAV